MKFRYNDLTLIGNIKYSEVDCTISIRRRKSRGLTAATTRLMHLQKAHVIIDEMVQNTWYNWMTKDE